MLCNLERVNDWYIHVCGAISFDKICREHGVPRVEVGTPWFTLGAALTPGARYAHRMDKPPHWILAERRR